MSPIRMLNTLLLIAAVVGSALTYRAGRLRRELLAEQNRLEQLVGSLPIDDPTKMHVRALDTGQPLHFAWRVYLPAGFKSQWRGYSGGGSGGPRSRPRESIARVRFRENDEGILEVFVHSGGSSSRTTTGNRKLAELLHGRWDELEVEQLGRDQLVVVEPDEIATLVRVTFSESLKLDAKQKLSKRSWKRYQETLFDYRFGSHRAFQKAETAKSPKNP